MEKLDKVIAGLIACIGSDCGNCEYILDRCESRLLNDALDLLKEYRIVKAERDLAVGLAQAYGEFVEATLKKEAKDGND